MEQFNKQILETVKPEQPAFPDDMYEVSGFLTPNSRHYQKSKRFDSEITRLARDPQQIHEKKETFWVLEAENGEAYRVAKLLKDDIAHLSEQKRRARVEELLTSDNAETRAAAYTYGMRYFNKESIGLTRQFINSDNETDQVAGIGGIWRLPKDEQLQILADFLSSEKSVLQVAALTQSRLLPNEKRLSFFQDFLSSKNPALINAAITNLHELSAQDRVTLLRDSRFTKYVIQNPLYLKNPEVTEEKFSRIPFAKTGSETTLLGGNLKNKLIIRHLHPQTFLAWQRAFEAGKEWEMYNFDYVPIEPIQSYRVSDKGLVDVAAGVLDVSLARWTELFSPLFEEELLEISERIEFTLEQMGVIHDHAHMENFVLRFFRKGDGTIDLEKVPRLYIIDFDQAKS